MFDADQGVHAMAGVLSHTLQVQVNGRTDLRVGRKRQEEGGPVLLTRPSVDQVIALAALQVIVACIATQDIIAIAAAQQIYVIAATQAVVASVATQMIDSRPARQGVGIAVAKQSIIEGRADQVLDAAQLVIAISADGRIAGEVDKDIADGHVIAGGINARSAEQAVIAQPAGQQVVALSSIQGVIAGAAVEDVVAIQGCILKCHTDIVNRPDRSRKTDIGQHPDLPVAQQQVIAVTAAQRIGTGRAGKNVVAGVPCQLVIAP